MKSKEEKIKEFLSKPIQIGDEIIFTGEGNGSKDSSVKALADVVDLKENKVYFKSRYYNKLQERDIKDVKKSIRHIGENPFIEPVRFESYQIDIEQLFYRAGVDRDYTNKMEKYFDVDIPECVFDPIVTDVDGKEIELQRGLVWNLEQKQLLIESIYNRVDIGKFTFRKRSFSWVENRINKGILKGTGFSDLIDGKQRTSTLVSFVRNEFKDFNGLYYEDLSRDAQREFLGYRNLVYVSMPESTTDKQVIEQFLAVNHTGVPMSKEHIEFVKSIRV